MQRKIEISQQTILFTLSILAGAWIILQIRDILFLLFIAFLLMTAIYPIVLGLERLRIPRAISVLLVYVIIIGTLGVSFASSIPALVTQSTKLVQELPRVIARVLPYWNIDIVSLTQQLTPLGENVVKVTVGIFSNIVTTVTVLVFTFYFLLERRRAEMTLVDLFGQTIGKQTAQVLRLIERRLGGWVRGELLLMSFIGVLTYIGLTILRVDFALPLAILAGLLEIVPMIGPIISAVPAVLVAFATSPILAVSTAGLYFVIQQVENNLLVPWIMKKSVGLSPLVTIIALMIGGRLAGLVGAVLAVPFVLVFQAVLNSFLTKKNPSP